MPPHNHPNTDQTSALAARIAAFEVLRQVLHRKRPLDDALAMTRAFTDLQGSDRGYAAFIVRTCLKRLGQIDALIAHCIPDPLPRKARPVHDVLRVGIAQLLFSVTAEHAAVATTVDLCRAVGQQPFAKLTNAVMRRLQREGQALLAAQSRPGANTPDWLWQSWVTAYGGETAAAITETHLLTPPIDLTVKSDSAGWAAKLGGTAMLNGTVRLDEAEDVTALAGFQEGAWWVQDAAARLAVTLLGVLAGKRVIDLCAAPGGKTLELLAAGAEVTALDISERRMQRVRENLQRTGYDATLVVADARTWQPDSPADIVLLDAPCSSTGTLRRHPDVAHLKTVEDIEKLATVQAGLLDAAAQMVAPGGILMYVTCSLQPEEGPAPIRAFLKRNPAFSRQPITTAELPGLPQAITADGDLRTLPHFLAEAGGMDGFFVARLQKAH
ncbi:MAG: 16S rRNA (cytosine(967)-C(5))-methyltransferase RsmB [Rhodospirillales bacterium]